MSRFCRLDVCWGAGIVVEQQDFQRWLELAARLLTAAPREAPSAPVSRALAETFAGTVGSVRRTGGSCRIEPFRCSCAGPVDVGFYARHALDAPLLRHFSRWPHDEQMRSSDEVDPCTGEPAAAVILRQLRDDGLDHGLAFPLPATLEEGRRWWVVARADPFGEDECGFARAIHPLVVGLEQHASAMAAFAALTAPPGAPEPSPDQVLDGDPRAVLTEREHAVLVLMEQGLIATAIGHRLGVSSRTVSKHQGHIYRKLGTTDRLTTVLRAQRVGLLAPSG